MKIAQVSPLFENVPSHLYGGTERIVGFLTEELVRMGHDVTLYASGDSETSARLVPVIPKALRLDRRHIHEPIASHVQMMEYVHRDADEFDVIHFHVDYIHYSMMRRHRTPYLTTLHGRQDYYELPRFYREFREAPLVSISNSQRAPVPEANWLGTVYHGLPLDLLEHSPDPKGGYLAFLGRITPEKGPGRAIEIAQRTGMPLKIAAKIDPEYQAYFDETVKPGLSSQIEFIGEVNDERKSEFLGNACALLFPIDWPEPFGLVMIESMACGTPVVAWHNGSVPEVIDDGVTGFIVESIPEAVAAVGKACRLDRAVCRRRFEERFSATRMAEDYVKLYRRLEQGLHAPKVTAMGLE